MFLYAEAHRFFDGDGDLVRPLRALDLSRARVAPFLLYVPDRQLLGGAIGVGGTVPIGTECGRLFEGTRNRCIAGVGDPYVELAWSRFFGTVRPPRHGGYPVPEGIAVKLGVGAVVPIGDFDPDLAASQGLVIGNNIWDIAPSLALTYTTKPLLADGTELSVKTYWNNYLENPATDYRTGSIISTDFALSERIGQAQVGVAGFYAVQVEDDQLFGMSVPPDGGRTEGLSLGPILAYDLPEYGTSFKIKALTSVMARNAVDSFGIAVSWVIRF